MTLNRSYTRELEHLISSVLIPVYDKHYREKGQLPPYAQFPKGLLKDIVKPKKECALFKPVNTRLT